MKQKYLYLLLILAFYGTKLHAQQWDSLHYAFEYHYGFIMSHHPEMKHLSNVHLSAFELSVEEDCAGGKFWHQLYRFPRRGISLWYSSLGNNQYLGYSIALIPYMNFSLIRKNDYRSYFQLGCGMAYLSNPYDRIDNPKNNTIGSHLNAAIRLSYDQSWRFAQHWELISGLGITHFSNGAFKMPNYGVNNMTLSLGLNYSVNYTKPTPSRIFRRNIIDNRHWDIYTLFGTKENYPPAGPRYYTYSLAVDHVFRYSFKFDYYIGTDIMYDQAKLNSLQTDSIPIKHNIENTQIGLKLGAAWNMGNFSVHTQLGCYLYSKDKSNGILYDRLILRYRYKKHWMFNLALKTHYAKADVFEAGIGYRIW